MSALQAIVNPLKNVITSDLDVLFGDKIAEKVLSFHKTLTNYQPTPLIELTAKAQSLGIKQLRVKDESHRFSLNAFKSLGASYAIARNIAQQLDLDPQQLDFSQIKKQLRRHSSVHRKPVFATATDGNHGKAVAWAAAQFDCRSHIYMPQGSSSQRVNAIKQWTDMVTVTTMNYDDTVEWVWQQAKLNNWQLVQDTAWSGYTDIPNDIMRGYFSLIAEIEQQDPEFWPTHVILQAGVGSLAAAMVAYFTCHAYTTPFFILVEPTNAACFYNSIALNDGKAHQTLGDLSTIMAGLACGKPSLTAWPLLKNGIDVFIACEDSVAQQGMLSYAYPLGSDQAIISGESAAVTLGVIENILRHPALKQLKNECQFDEKSHILLLSTEGDTDPAVYQKIVGSAQSHRNQ